jgi:hypothetical protein
MPAIHFGKSDPPLQVVVLQSATFSAFKMMWSMQSRRIQVAQTSVCVLFLAPTQIKTTQAEACATRPPLIFNRERRHGMAKFL